MRAAILDDPAFRASALKADFDARPLGFVDIGARGGVQAYAAALAPITAVLAFEPDPAAAASVLAALGTDWHQSVVEPVAIGGTDGIGVLNLYASGMNHSLLPAAARFRQRYDVGSLADRGAVEVTLATLDHILFDIRGHEPYWGEIVKLDVQGAECLVIEGAKRTLGERTVAVATEVCFLEIYDRQPLFADIERALVAEGFTFYGFLSLQGWSQKYIDKAQALGRERLCFGDAIFFRDPLDRTDAHLDTRRWQCLYLAALMFGFVDFAAEIAAAAPFPAAEADRLIRAALGAGHYPPARAIAEVADLHQRMAGDPATALIELGRFVERLRTQWDVSDAGVPRRVP